MAKFPLYALSGYNKVYHFNELFVARKAMEIKMTELIGNACPRGAEYGRNELKNPKRVITSTVRTASSEFCRCPVKTNGAIPKEKMFEVMKMLEDIELKVPVHTGDIVIENLFSTGVHVVACKEILK